MSSSKKQREAGVSKMIDLRQFSATLNAGPAELMNLEGQT